MSLLARRDIAAGEELTLDYGARPLRDMLRGYGFTPDQACDPYEVFEDWGASGQALLVQGSGQVRPCRSQYAADSGRKAHVWARQLMHVEGWWCLHCMHDPPKELSAACLHYPGVLCIGYIAKVWRSRCVQLGACRKRAPALTGERVDTLQGACFRVAEACVLVEPGAHPLLEMAGQASILYVVQDDASICHNRAGSAALVSVVQPAAGRASASAQPGQTPACQGDAASSACETEPEEARLKSGTPTNSHMDPDTERGIALHVAAMCAAFTAGAPTSVPEDSALLDALTAQATAAMQPSMQRSGGTHGLEGDQQQEWAARWRQKSHLRMALQYRLQRKLLLARVADDLMAHARMLSYQAPAAGVSQAALGQEQ